MTALAIEKQPTEKEVERANAVGIRRILLEHWEKGETMPMIAEALNSAGYLTPTGRPFSGSIVSNECVAMGLRRRSNKKRTRAEIQAAQEPHFTEPTKLEKVKAQGNVLADMMLTVFCWELPDEKKKQIAAILCA